MRKASAARENSVDPPRNEITSNPLISILFFTPNRPVGRQNGDFRGICLLRAGRPLSSCRVPGRQSAATTATQRVHISGDMSGRSFSPSRDASVVDESRRLAAPRSSWRYWRKPKQACSLTATPKIVTRRIRVGARRSGRYVGESETYPLERATPGGAKGLPGFSPGLRGVEEFQILLVNRHVLAKGNCRGPGAAH